MEIVSYNRDNTITVRFNEIESDQFRAGAIEFFSIADEITAEVERVSLRLREDEPLRNVTVTAIVPLSALPGVQLVE